MFVPQLTTTQMKTTTQAWIPNPNEIVEWQGKLHKVISVNLGGKCVIKKITTTKRITKIIKDIDISELKQIN